MRAILHAVVIGAGLDRDAGKCNAHKFIFLSFTSRVN